MFEIHCASMRKPVRNIALVATKFPDTPGALNISLVKLKGTSKILIVDDDPRHGQSVGDLLDAYGHPADIQTEGQSGLQALTNHHYDLLILDLNIPDLSGIEILKSMNANQINTRTIILSGESDLSNVTPILRLGAADYLQKPFEPEQLLNSVENALNQTRLERENESMSEEAEAASLLHEFLIKASPDVIYTLDSKGKITFLNKEIGNLFNQDSENLEGEYWEKMVGQNLANTLKHRIDERRTGTRATQHYEFDLTNAQGDQSVIDLSSMGLYENGEFKGTYGVVRDVTQSRLMSRRLAQSQQKFYGLFMDSPDAVFISELNSARLIEGNDKFQAVMELMGASTSETDEFIWPDQSGRSAFVEQLWSNPQHTTIRFTRDVDGQTKYLELTARILDLEDSECMLATLRDRTEDEQAQLDRLKLETQLQQSSKMEAVGQLAGGIAHDFNNILASIVGYAELVMGSRERLRDDQIDDYLSEVVTASQRAKDLISQMLRFTRVDQRDVKPLSVVESIVEVSRLLRAAIPASIEIHTEFAESLGEVVIDKIQLHQILINLLVNARDAIKGNGFIRISVYRGKHQERCCSCGEPIFGDNLVMSVEDSGHGIPEAIMSKIFDAYMTTREPGKGTGIGLRTVHSLVHDYSGHITLESEVGRGSNFRIHLPFASQASIQDTHQPGHPGSATIPSEKGVELAGRILLVDDEVSVSNFIGEVLRNNGYEVVIYNDSLSALAYLKSNLDDVALVVTDQVMPQLTGLQLIDYVKGKRPELPVILITGFTHASDMDKVKRLGVEKFLTKPFHINELLDTISALTEANQKSY